MDLTPILDAYRATLADNRVSRAELKGVRALLRDADLDQRELAILRSEIFELARSAQSSANAAELIDWLEDASKPILEVSRKPPNRVWTECYFSPGEDCLRAIIGKLRGARRSVDICVFTITDDRIVNEILAAAHRRVPVRIITDNDKSRDAGSDIRRLAREGVAVKVDVTTDHMHHKFAILDGNVVLTGSYNWTRSACSHNQENLIATNDEGAVEAFTGEFQKLWRTMADY